MIEKSSRSLISAVKSRDVCSLVFISSLNKFGAFQNRFPSNLKCAVAQHLVTQPRASRASHAADYLCNSLKQRCILPERARRDRMWLAGTTLRFPLGFSLFCGIFTERKAPQQEVNMRSSGFVGHDAGNPPLPVRFLYSLSSVIRCNPAC